MGRRNDPPRRGLGFEPRSPRPRSCEVTRKNTHGRHAGFPEARTHHGRPACTTSAHLVAVHPIVVRKEVSLEEFEGDTRGHNALAPPLASETLVRRRQEDGPDAFAPPQGELPNRIGDKQDVCPAALGFRHTVVQPRREAAFHLALNTTDQRYDWLS